MSLRDRWGCTVSDEEQKHTDKAEVSRRAFLKGGAAATGALTAALIPGTAEAQLPDATEPDARHTTVSMSVNGRRYRADVPNSTTLAQFLREDLKLTGTKLGCDRTQCGACTVVVNGRNVYSCTTLALQAEDAEVLTIEGLSKDDALHPIQQAFIDDFAFQCGYCTPGMIMAAKTLLDENPNPTREEIIHHMDGNICRCTGYVPIVAAIERAAGMIAKENKQ